MIISLSGTPGTGKTSAAKEFDPKRFEIVSMNTLTEGYSIGTDEVRGSTEVDIDCLVRDLQEGTTSLPDAGDRDVIIEGHLSHHLPADIIIVLRTSTGELDRRLTDRSYEAGKIRENMEAEAMGVISLEALDTQRPLYEVDTTNLTPSEVAKRCQDLIESRPPPLTDQTDIIDLTEEILEWY